MKISTLCLTLLLPLAAGLLLSSCEITGGDETVREVPLRVAGAYTNSSGIPSRQSGGRITLLSLVQSGDQLDGVDNQGGRWNGTIGRADSSQATFTLRGMTNTGVQVVITGTITVNGGEATMNGNWVEPSLVSSVRAEASVAQSPSPSPTPSPTPSPMPTAAPAPAA